MRQPGSEAGFGSRSRVDVRHRSGSGRGSGRRRARRVVRRCGRGPRVGVTFGSAAAGGRAGSGAGPRGGRSPGGRPAHRGARRDHPARARRSRSWDDREAAVAAAEERAAAALTTAHEEAAQLVAAAHAEAHRVRSRAQLQAREITEAAEQEAERLVLLRDSTRAEIQRLLRTLDGIRDALAYELQTGVPIPPQARQDADRQAVRTTTSAGAAAIGRRRGDLHRTRHIGLSTVDGKPTDDGPHGVG